MPWGDKVKKWQVISRKEFVCGGTTFQGIACAALHLAAQAGVRGVALWKQKQQWKILSGAEECMFSERSRTISNIQ